MTLAGSFVSRAFILLIRVAILASAVIDDSKDRSPPFEATDCEFLGFSKVGSIGEFSQLDLQINPNPDFSSFCKNPPDTWFLTRFLLDNPNHHRKSGAAVISLHRDEGTGLRDI